jgi:hypothetical protein
MGGRCLFIRISAMFGVDAWRGIGGWAQEAWLCFNLSCMTRLTGWWTDLMDMRQIWSIWKDVPADKNLSCLTRCHHAG